MVQLTENIILQKTRVDSLLHVKNLNLWGNDLTDVSILQKMPNVEVLSLSVNNISSLKDFSHCSKLTELYLRKNDVSNLKEIDHLKDLKGLRILWLCDNPCSEQENYRNYVIRNLSNLVKLDNTDITTEERRALSPLTVRDANRERKTAVPKTQAVMPSNVKPTADSEGETDSVRNNKLQRPRWNLPPENPLDRLSAQVADADPPSSTALPKHRSPSHPSMQSSRLTNNSLNAILLLLNDLDTEGLHVVRTDVESRLRRI